MNSNNLHSIFQAHTQDEVTQQQRTAAYRQAVARDRAHDRSCDAMLNAKVVLFGLTVVTLTLIWVLSHCGETSHEYAEASKRYLD